MKDCTKCALKHVSSAKILCQEAVTRSGEFIKKMVEVLAHLNIAEGHLVSEHQKISFRIRSFRKELENL